MVALIMKMNHCVVALKLKCCFIVTLHYRIGTFGTAAVVYLSIKVTKNEQQKKEQATAV